MFTNKEEQWAYIVENYLEVTDKKIDEDHWDLFCPTCDIVRGFQVVDTRLAQSRASTYHEYETDFSAPFTVYFRCPVCTTYKMWLLFRKHEDFTDDDGKKRGRYRYYRVTSIPNDGIEEMEELPENPPALRTAFRQAVRAMDANAHIAAAAMFRRAVQVITRQMLGAPSGNLGIELEWIVGKTYNGTAITSDFSENAYIVKEAGNQGAHPDADPDLLDFNQEDAENLQQIFMELVAELFVIPEAKKKAKENFMKRRKITPKPTPAERTK